ncbi:MAG: FAD-binding oxidoreductase [Bacteroidota bacterium]
MFSLWEKQSFLTSDILIIGAGITGLSAAATIKEKNPHLGVTVLERGILPTGASTKNAGFACFGSVSELLNDVKVLGEKGTLELVEKRWNGLQRTIERLGKDQIDLKVQSGYELLFENSNVLDQIDFINKLLSPLFGQPVYKQVDEKISAFGLSDANHLIENVLEGQLDTGKLISSLWAYCAGLGIKVHTGCEVLSIEEENGEVNILCEQGVFRAKKVGVCTNAFTKKVLDKSLDISPGRGIVMSIQPKTPLKFSGTFHYDEGYYYFRDYYGKLLFGGGRNLDLETEATAEFGINEIIRKKLIRDIESIILPDQDYEIEMEWSGIMAFGENKAPIVKSISNKVAIGVRLGGMGVAIGSLVGEEVANLLLG